MKEPYMPESLQSVPGVTFGFCCDMAKTRLVTMSAEYPSMGKNQWLAVDGDDVVGDIIYCPYCGIKLPTSIRAIMLEMNED